jgi:hypothetical protein
MMAANAAAFAPQDMLPDNAALASVARPIAGQSNQVE